MDVCLLGRMTTNKAGCIAVPVLGMALLPVGLYAGGGSIGDGVAVMQRIIRFI